MKSHLFCSFLIFCLFFTNNSISNEIIKDRDGNYFLMQKNGTFKKLPKPKPGFKYIIKKKNVAKKKKRYF